MLRNPSEPIAVCYIRGEMKLEFYPEVAHSFSELKPNVEITRKGDSTLRAIEALVIDKESNNGRSWEYLALVQKGDYSVKVSLNGVAVSKDITAKGAEINSLDFRFTEQE